MKVRKLPQSRQVGPRSLDAKEFHRLPFSGLSTEPDSGSGWATSAIPKPTRPACDDRKFLPGPGRCPRTASRPSMPPSATSALREKGGVGRAPDETPATRRGCRTKPRPFLRHPPSRAGVSSRPVETPAYQRAAGVSPRVACWPLLVFVRGSSQSLDVLVRRRCSLQACERGSGEGGPRAATKGPRDGSARWKVPAVMGPGTASGRTVIKSGPIARCGAHAPLFVLSHTACRWNAHWCVRRNHLRRSVEKLGFGSLAGDGVRPQAGGVRVIGRRTTEYRMRQRGCSSDHRVARRAAGSSPQSGGLARRRGPTSSPAASPSRRAASLLHPRCYFRS